MPRHTKRRFGMSRKMRRSRTRKQGQSQAGGKRPMGRSMARGIAGGGPLVGL